ncbi:histone-lysine N-methyltransferase SUV39H2-like isoform X1 [Neocloeon triangulifer]|uniref:histone-lysine N-methyltransferase SUV39H2-like isoform X1 n=1 Tax=Neocloeon triangulifer TaxID=2078957 RepID=UPI00286F0DF1|nr:histone-lysine N-methyltransferase SUV39H2-like isoform X1 [Neocloeon triangulifer]
MEKGEAVENLVAPSPKKTVKNGHKTQQVAVDGSIKCVSEPVAEIAPLEEKPKRVSSTRKRSISESTAPSNPKSPKPKRKKSSIRGKRRRPMDPCRSLDARDTETRVVDPNDPNPDETVGKVDEEYEVEDVLKRVYFEKDFHYLIKWKGWPSENNTWEPEGSLGNAKKLLRAFYDRTEEEQPSRFRDIAAVLPQLQPLEGAAAVHECKVVMKMTKADYESIFYLPAKEEPLPNHKLLQAHIKKLSKKPDEELEKKVKRMILQRECVRLQFEQQKMLKDFVDELNKSEGDTLLSIENQVDLSLPPLNFKPLNKNQPVVEVVISDDPPIGCECDVCDGTSNCCPRLAGGKDMPHEFAYHNKLLQLPHGKPIYECNKKCKCSADCGNRVLQNGLKVRLKIFRTRNMGWGVAALDDIPQGTFVCEYIGQVLGRWAVLQRQAEEYAGKPNYIFDLDFNKLDPEECRDENGYELFPYGIDATVVGNVAHFVNHSCEPNLGVYVVYVNCLDPQLPHLGMYAINDIKAGEQIFFDYEAQYHKRRRIKPAKPSKKGSKYACGCGKASCRRMSFQSK